MGHVDTTLLYNGFNSYVLEAGEVLWGNTFDVNLYSHISLQFVTIRLDGTASVRLNVRWIGEDNKRLGVADTQIPFDVTNRWSRKTATLEVPEEAFKVTVSIENTSGSDFYISCPMSEAGEIATAFDPALASKMAWHDANGSYVGFLSADQIVAGILRSVTGDSGFDLEAPKIWMKSADGAVTWEATPENPFSLTDASGKSIGGLAYINGLLRVIAGALTNNPDAGYYGVVGTWDMPENVKYELEARSLTGLMVFSENNKTTPLVALGSRTDELENFMEINVKGEVIFVASDNHVVFALEQAMLVLNGDPADGHFGASLKIERPNGYTQDVMLSPWSDQSQGGETIIQSGGGSITGKGLRLSDGVYGEDTVEMWYGTRGLGVDSAGAYKRTGLTKTRL